MYDNSRNIHVYNNSHARMSSLEYLRNASVFQMIMPEKCKIADCSKQTSYTVFQVPKAETAVNSL